MDDALLGWEYDLFISHVHRETHGSSAFLALIQRLSQSFEERTGRKLRLFVDREGVRSANLWERLIHSALSNSAAIVAVYSPSYFVSEWCCREWDTFRIVERERRESLQLLPYESLIFPVLLSEPAVSEDSDTDRRTAEMQSRQAVDLTNVPPDTELFNQRVDRLVSDILLAFQKISLNTRRPRVGADHLAESAQDRTTPLVTTYSGASRQRQIQLLAYSKSATIVGISNTWVPECVEAALSEKRRAEGSAAFWDHLHVVFLSEDLLPYVNDGTSADFSSVEDAIRHRGQAAGYAKRRLMSLLLRIGVHGRWTLYSYPHLLPFVGNLFTMPAGERVVQLSMLRPSRPEEDNLNIDFLDRVDQFFESMFREVVESAKEEHEIVIMGVPRGDGTFWCRSARFRRAVLVEGRNVSDWVAAVVAVTWRRGMAGPEPLLQVNTPQNSTREIGKASHVSGYINLQDRGSHGGTASGGTDESVLTAATASSAIARELWSDFSIRNSHLPPQLIDTLRFYYTDKENLYFYVFAQEIPATHVFADAVQMFSWTVQELVRVRIRHVLVNALAAIEAPLSDEQRKRAGTLLAANLRAHGEPDTASRVSAALVGGAAKAATREDLLAKVQQNCVLKYAAGRELVVDGLAGLQYRAFFSHLLPAYARLGVAGAQEALTAIRGNRDRQAAVDELSLRYQDEQLICSLPIEV
jgi:hypothetical protein